MQGSTLRCCHELLPEFRCLSCSSHLHVWLSTYALLFHYCSEYDLCCGRVLIGPALQCVYVHWCVSACMSVPPRKWLRMYMSACWQREQCRSLSLRPSTCGSPPVRASLSSVPNMRSVPPHPCPALLGSVRPCLWRNRALSGRQQFTVAEENILDSIYLLQ